MVKFTVEQVRSIMGEQKNIRNMSVIAHVDHGKSTLSDALICKAGILNSKVAGQARALDNRPDEIERGITIKSTGVSLYYSYDLSNSGVKENQQEYLINLIDSPGHVDFSSEVTAALRVTDGALVIVDTVEGVCVQTETVLRQAMQEKIKPILMINKVDRSIVELKNESEEIYRQFIKTIDMVNVVISAYEYEDMGKLDLDPTKGNVIFGAGKDQWGFTLRTFAKVYSQKFKIEEDKLIQKLWGDNYFDQEANKWKTEPVSDSGKPLKRTFVQFIMDPICELIHSIMDKQKKTYQAILEKLNIKFTQAELKEANAPKKLVKLAMSRWLPAADCVLQTMILHLPSPATAQKYRAPYLYEGPQDDKVMEAMRNCDPKGPLTVYISKMIPIDNNRFAAFGRVFSGTIIAGQKVRILGANYKIGEKTEIYEKSISQLGVYMMGKTPETVPDVPCGNTVAIMGIDEYLLKTGTITGIEFNESYPIRAMKYSVSPVYRVAVKAKNAADLPKLQKGLRKLSKSDPLLKVEIEQTNQIVLSGSGELHIEICLNDLKAFSQCDIIVSEPTVSYRETVTQKSKEQLLVKTTNKHNRLYGTCEPLHPDLIDMIENKNFLLTESKQKAKILIQQFEWEKTDTAKIWSFGPEDTGANVIVDCVKQAQYLNEIKDSVLSGFNQSTKHGVLAEETMRGARFNLTEAEVHSDSVHRNTPQIMPASRRLFHGLQLASSPTLLEPIFICEISAPSEVLGKVYQTLTQRRGIIIDETQSESNNRVSVVKAYLPVAESFGLSSTLRANTHGMAFPQCFFDHWKEISGLPFEDPKATALVMNIRKRKGLKQQLPQLQDYVDKL